MDHLRKAIKNRPSPVPAALLLGPTGSGKSPLGNHMARHGLFGKQVYHLDFGAELRGIASGNRAAAAFSSSEIEFINGVLVQGLLLENEHFILAEKIISLFLERSRFPPAGLLLLNGMPRHAGQARDIDRIALIHAVVALSCCSDDVVCRLRENTGGDRTGRTDDNGALVAEKLKTYRERTEPLIDHYVRAGSPVYRLDISSRTTTEQAYRELLRLSAGDPPVPFVAEPPQR